MCLLLLTVSNNWYSPIKWSVSDHPPNISIQELHQDYHVSFVAWRVPQLEFCFAQFSFIIPLSSVLLFFCSIPLRFFVVIYGMNLYRNWCLIFKEEMNIDHLRLERVKKSKTSEPRNELSSHSQINLIDRKADFLPKFDLSIIITRHFANQEAKMDVLTRTWMKWKLSSYVSGLT